jgi:hypothetical protein
VAAQVWANDAAEIERLSGVLKNYLQGRHAEV